MCDVQDAWRFEQEQRMSWPAWLGLMVLPAAASFLCALLLVGLFAAILMPAVAWVLYWFEAILRWWLPIVMPPGGGVWS